SGWRAVICDARRFNRSSTGVESGSDKSQSTAADVSRTITLRRVLHGQIPQLFPRRMTALRDLQKFHEVPLGSELTLRDSTRLRLIQITSCLRVLLELSTCGAILLGRCGFESSTCHNDTFIKITCPVNNNHIQPPPSG